MFAQKMNSFLGNTLHSKTAFPHTTLSVVLWPIGTQMNIAKMIKKECKADCVLAVKENQKTLYDDISDYFRIDEIRENLTACENYRSTSEKAHGQFEIRKYYITDETLHGFQIRASGKA